MDSAALNSIYYLCNATNLLENPILKSYNYLKCYKHAQQQNVNLPGKFKDVVTRCPKCLNDRTQNNTTFRTKAEVRDRFLSKLSGKGRKLTTFQWKYLKKSGAANQNAMTLNCRICGHIAVKKMKKPEKPAKVVPVKIEQRAKKKKKRRDKYSGLNATAVLGLKRAVEKSLPLKGEVVAEREGRLHKNKKAALKHKSKLSDMLSAKTKISKNLKSFLESI